MEGSSSLGVLRMYSILSMLEREDKTDFMFPSESDESFAEEDEIESRRWRSTAIPKPTISPAE